MEELDFLGSSQTFIGVLATIVLLCIISDSKEGSGNFLYAIISKIIDRTKKVVEEQKNNMVKSKGGRDFVELQKDFEKRIDDLQKKARGSKEISSFIEKKTIEFKLMWNDYVSYFSEKYFSPILLKIQEIRDSTEQTLSPLYVFAYCIVIFLCDEIWCSTIASHTLICPFFLFFTSISCVYLGLLWHKFCKEFKHIPSLHSRISFPELIQYCNRGRELCILNLYLIYIIISVSLIFKAFKFPDTGALIFISLTLCMVLYFTGNKHIRLEESYGKYRHSFLFYHFCAISSLSLIVALILECPFPFTDFSKTDYSILLKATKWGMFLFVIFFGLIAPFLFPYRAILYILHFANECEEKATFEIETEWNRINNWMINFELQSHQLIDKNQSQANHSDDYNSEIWY